MKEPRLLIFPGGDRSQPKPAAPGVMLANNWNNENPVGWFMSEKLDGIRAVWNGRDLVSRNGNVFNAPEWFKARLPDLPLDGELWLGRGRFQTVAGIVRRKKDADWSGVRFMVFDCLTEGTAEERQALLAAAYLPDHVELVNQVPCLSLLHLEHFESQVLEAGGEGVMIRQAGSPYESGRSRSLLKVKRFLDAEAVVTGYQAGEGKHEGRLGALVCKFEGKTFKLGTGLSDSQRENPPKIGARVTFSFFERTDAGVPRFPVFLTVRDYE